MTYLELVNEVLTRLREPNVTSVSGEKYTLLIGALVNDAKRAVEDATEWVQLIGTETVTSVAGTADYDIPNTNDRTTIFSVIDEDRYKLERCSARELIEAAQFEVNNNRPAKWAVVGASTARLQTLRLSPTPESARTFSVNHYSPACDLVNDSDEPCVPYEPIYLRAYAYAIKERGEDNGQYFQEALDQAKKSLARHITLNYSTNGGQKVWQVL